MMELTQRQIEIARDNHAFLYVVVGMELGSRAFEAALRHSFDQPSQLYVEPRGDYSGYLHINATDVKQQCSHGCFIEDAVKGMLGRVAMLLSDAITGDLNERATVNDGPYQFDFKVTKYERDGDHGFEVVEDPSVLPADERLGRFVELTITIPPK